MAAKKSYQWFGGAKRVNSINSNSNSEVELDEADIWGTNNTQTISETKRVSNNINPLKRTLSKKMISNHIDHVHQRPLVATLLPVNVPDWSKILGDEYRCTRMDNDEEGGGDKDEIVPHVYR
ncbi:hypothetical protein Leryth_000894 [Lithospermum erythrorhizon]|nr:hypothetical protein Leryth_000894 [Lithospermum erythrorhizon]